MPLYMVCRSESVRYMHFGIIQFVQTCRCYFRRVCLHRGGCAYNEGGCAYTEGGTALYLEAGGNALELGRLFARFQSVDTKKDVDMASK